MLSSVALYSQVTMIVMTSGSLFEGVTDKRQAGMLCKEEARLWIYAFPVLVGNDRMKDRCGC